MLWCLKTDVPLGAPTGSPMPHSRLYTEETNQNLVSLDIRPEHISSFTAFSILLIVEAGGHWFKPHHSKVATTDRVELHMHLWCSGVGYSRTFDQNCRILGHDLKAVTVCLLHPVLITEVYLSKALFTWFWYAWGASRLYKGATWVARFWKLSFTSSSCGEIHQWFDILY